MWDLIHNYVLTNKDVVTMDTMENSFRYRFQVVRSIVFICKLLYSFINFHYHLNRSPMCLWFQLGHSCIFNVEHVNDMVVGNTRMKRNKESWMCMSTKLFFFLNSILLKHYELIKFNFEKITPKMLIFHQWYFIVCLGSPLTYRFRIVYSKVV